MTLGEMIKNYRMKNKVSMEYVANLCGITKGYVAMLERNVNSKTGRPVKPTIETIVKVCNGLHFDLDTVFNELDDDYEITISSSSSPIQLTPQERHLVISFRGLNEDGREKAVERIDELLDVPRYRQVSLQEDVDQIVGDVLGQSEKLKRG